MSTFPIDEAHLPSSITAETYKDHEGTVPVAANCPVEASAVLQSAGFSQSNICEAMPEVQLVEVVKELDSLEMSVRLQPHLPIHRLLDDEDHSATVESLQQIPKFGCRGITTYHRYHVSSRRQGNCASVIGAKVC